MTWQDSIWQWFVFSAISSTVLLVVAGLSMKLCRQPVSRVRMIELAFLACLFCPALNLIPGVAQFSLPLVVSAFDYPAERSGGDRQRPLAPSSMPMTFEITGAEHAQRPDIRSERVSGSTAVGLQPAPASMRQTKESVANQTARFGFALPSVRIVIPAIYASCLTALVCWLVVGVLRLKQIRKSARPAPDSARKLLNVIGGAAATRVRLSCTDRIDVPIIFGWRSPTILLPQRLCSDQERHALRCCLAHEWSHIERNDIVSWYLAGVTRVLFFYQPLAWWLRRHLRLCQDLLADSRAIECTGETEKYAQLLIQLARRQQVTIPALAVVDRRSHLSRRITMLLNLEKPLSRRCGRVWSITVTMAAVVLVVSVATVSLTGPATAEDLPKDDSFDAPLDQAKTDHSADAADKADKPKDVPAEKARPKANAKELRYFGRILDDWTGKPVEGASVTVRRSIYSTQKVVAETKHTTDTVGRYKFVIPPEQVSTKGLYIELDVTHADYATKARFGYGLGLIRKNEKAGARPFFEEVKLKPADTVTGRLVQPDGKPAANISILAYSRQDASNFKEYGSFAYAKSDRNGEFKVNVIKNSEAAVWIQATEFAPSEHIVAKNRDLGLIGLTKGIRVKGKVLDVDGNPVEDFTFEANHLRDPAKSSPVFNAVATSISRTATSDKNGEFKMDPLPPGNYRLRPRENSNHHVDAVFVTQSFSIAEDQETVEVEVRAVPHVIIEAQYLNAKGEKSTGHPIHVFGVLDGQGFFGHAKGGKKENGRVVIKAPHGLQRTQLMLSTSEHGSLRYRLKKDDPWQKKTGRVNLGTLEDDVTGIEIVKYRSPILVVGANDKDGKPIKEYSVVAKYSDGQVRFEKQKNGHWRSKQLLPSEKITVTITADGYAEHTETVGLKEGGMKTLVAELKTID